MPRISALPSLTTADNSDELPIVDVSASVTKKITRGDLLKAPLPTNSVTTAAIADGAVTSGKINAGAVSYTPTYTGFSSNPTILADYYKIGTMVVLNLRGQSNGTSNSTAFTISLPVPCDTSNLNQRWSTVCSVTNTNASELGMVTINPADPSIATLFRSFNFTTWTNSGVKGLYQATIIYKAAS